MRIVLGSLLVLSLAAPALSSCSSPQKGLRGTETPVLYPLPPDLPRVQFLTSISRSDEIVESGSAFHRFITGSEGPVAAVQGPWGVAARNDSVYVCDLRQRTVVVIDLAAREFRSLGDGGRGKLRKPVQCEFDELGNLLVADRERRQIVIFGPDEKYVSALGPVDDEFLPVDVETRGREVYVCDIGNRCIQVIDRETGVVTRTIGGPEDLTSPTSFALDDSGNCHVVDSIQNRVIVFQPDGDLLRIVGGPGDTVGQFGRARGIDVDQDGNIFVVDAASEVCQIFTREGEIAMYFGGPGVGPGNLFLPAGVCVTTTGLEPLRHLFSPELDIDRLIIVISQFGPRIVSFYGFGSPRQSGS